MVASSCHLHVAMARTALDLINACTETAARGAITACFLCRCAVPVPIPVFVSNRTALHSCRLSAFIIHVNCAPMGNLVYHRWQHAAAGGHGSARPNFSSGGGGALGGGPDASASAVSLFFNLALTVNGSDAQICLKRTLIFASVAWRGVATRNFGRGCRACSSQKRVLPPQRASCRLVATASLC